jgi:hypothetical protein
MPAPLGVPEGGGVDVVVAFDEPPQPDTAKAIVRAATTASEAVLTAVMDLRM